MNVNAHLADLRNKIFVIILVRVGYWAIFFLSLPVVAGHEPYSLR
jgi:hypothetical protein